MNIPVTTIEKHLAVMAEKDTNAQLIYSIWNLNKNNLKKALSTIQITFPHYSVHDYSHADTIIKNIELFLGDNRIKELSPTDAWLLLMAAYTHDIGMVVFMKDLQEKMTNNDFLKELEEKSNNKYDIDLAESAQILLKLLNGEDRNPKENNIEYAFKIKRAITILSAELFRKIHHEKSREILTSINEHFYNEFNKFYSPDIPIRFMQILGDIAYGHGIDFDAVFELLPYQSNGFCSDYMHPRFVGYLLRIGDLLDVDDKRFNQFTTKVFTVERNKESQAHEAKHASIKHLLVTPENIEVTVDCKENEHVFRLANQWFDWLKDEVSKQNREWHLIRPKYLSGLAPTISKNKIKVLFNGVEVENSVANLQFGISKEKVFEIFEGSALYDDPSFVFLREITQNAVDATKIQLWKDINKGVYNSFIKEHINTKYKIDTSSWGTNDIVSNILFPQDIPDNIYANYTCELIIDWADQQKEILTIKLIDRGCGINKDILLRMTTQVGTSRQNDNDYTEFKSTIPYFLKPTGAFGLGLQSIFIVTNEFEMKSKSDDDNGWKITFRSARSNEYISTQREEDINHIGTTLTIHIPENKFADIFSSSFDVNDIEKYDSLTDEIIGSPYLLNMRKFISEDLLEQQFLTCSFLGRPISDWHGSEDIHLAKQSPIDIELQNPNRDKNILTSIHGYREKNDKVLKIVVFENYKELIGSQIIIEFPTYFINTRGSGFDYINTPSYSTAFSIRGVDVDKIRNLYFMPYSAVKVNLLNPDSDRILNIARSRIIKKEVSKLYENLHIVLAETLNELRILIEKNIEQLQKFYGKKEISICYWHSELTRAIISSSNFQPHISSKLIYGTTNLPESIMASYGESITKHKPVSLYDFFEIQDIYIQNIDGYVEHTVEKKEKFYHPTLTDYKNIFLKVVDPIFMSTDKIIIWHHGYLYQYLSIYYSISAIIINNDLKLKVATKLSKTQLNKFIPVEIDSRSLNTYFAIFALTNRRAYARSRFGRLIFHPISKYADTLAVKQLPENSFGSFPRYTRHGIISPFKSSTDLDLIIKEESFTSTVDIAQIKQVLKEKYLDKLIPETLLNHILEHYSSDKFTADKSLIQKKYIELASDIIHAYITNN